MDGWDEILAARTGWEPSNKPHGPATGGMRGTTNAHWQAMDGCLKDPAVGLWDADWIDGWMRMDRLEPKADRDPSRKLRTSPLPTCDVLWSLRVEAT